MPCNSDHMNANDREINLSVVYGLLDELKTGKLPENFGTGYDKRVYCKGLSKEHLDKKTEELCSKLQKVKNIKGYSLELQVWWRDHQAADKERLEQELKQHKTEEARKSALSKLTISERKLLGL